MNFKLEEDLVAKINNYIPMHKKIIKGIGSSKDQLDRFKKEAQDYFDSQREHFYNISEELKIDRNYLYSCEANPIDFAGEGSLDDQN